ncbi:hypothetical protein, partial [Staphylococcus aureus]|uniref:hypothetical protein n=1 Tax=Staphylococcus aureus TaxID=1280 RepID=UPI001CC2C962
FPSSLFFPFSLPFLFLFPLSLLSPLFPFLPPPFLSFSSLFFSLPFLSLPPFPFPPSLLSSFELHHSLYFFLSPPLLSADSPQDLLMDYLLTFINIYFSSLLSSSSPFYP